MEHELQVLILGGGFGGMAVAQGLERSHGPDGSPKWDITLIDRNSYLLFTPLLTEVAGGTVNAEDVAVPVRRLSPNVTFLQGDVVHVDLDHRQVTVEVGGMDGVPATTRTLSADHIVFALGSETNFHGMSEIKEHALTIKSVREAAEIRTKALALLRAGQHRAGPGAPARAADLRGGWWRLLGR